jgi:hypothetical protein
MFRRWRILARRYPGTPQSMRALKYCSAWAAGTRFGQIFMGSFKPFALAMAETYLNPTYRPIVLVSLSALVWGAWKIPQERRR